MSGKFVWIEETEVAKLPGWIWDKYRETPDPDLALTSVNLDRVVSALKRFAHQEGWDFDHAVFQLDRTEGFIGGLRYGIVVIPPKYADAQEVSQ